VAENAPTLWVLAGPNGAGKSSLAGALLRESGGDYHNPDEVARSLRERDPKLDQTRANALAWALGLRQLDRAVRLRADYFFETTLGGSTMVDRLVRAAAAGHDVRIWYAALASADLHVARVAARVRDGGHDIPEADIRRRYDASRRNLVALLPRLTELKAHDNTADADPARGHAPAPKLVLHWRDQRILAPKNLQTTPVWAKPIVAQALKHHRP
jgi:predicted ABC-type ATPase